MNKLIFPAFVSIIAFTIALLPASAGASSQGERAIPATVKVAPPQWKGESMFRDSAGRLIVEATSQRPETWDPERFAFLKDYPAAGGQTCGKPGASGNLDARAPAHVKSIVNKLAPKYDLDPRLVLAVIAVESNFHAAAVSPKNAQGLMQLIPGTAKRFGVQDPFNPSDNIRGGMLYLRWLLKTFNGNVSLALAGYNAGEKAVERYKGVPPYNETRQYVKKIHQLYGCDSARVIPASLASSGLGARNDTSASPAPEPYDLWNAAQATVQRAPDSRCQFRLGRNAAQRLAGGLPIGGTTVCR
jgi:Transglycosylase SLT domain